jgi:penicillin G amidase
MRRLDLYGVARQSVAAQDAAHAGGAGGLCGGRERLDRRGEREARGRGAPEFWLFAPEIAPWQPADSIAILKLMALQLSGHLEAEVLRARVSLLLPDDRLRDILPDAPGRPWPRCRICRAVPGVPSSGWPRWTMPPRPLSPFRPSCPGGGVERLGGGPDRSVGDGRTLLANDPHLG